MEPSNDFAPLAGAVWTDYDGVMPYDDYTISGGAAVVQMSYLGHR